MLDKIRQLGKETAIYGLSTIVGRFLTFLLTPLYAHILAPSELGVVATVFAYIAFLNVVYGYGMEAAYMRYSAPDESSSLGGKFTIPFLSVASTSFLFSGLLVWYGPTVASLSADPDMYSPLISLAAVILLLDTVALVPFASLRMARRARTFATIKIVSIAVNVICNVILLIVMKMGITGIFLSNIVSSGLALLLLLPTIARSITRGWSGSLYAALLRFGLPYLPAGLAAMMIQVIDRPILEALTDAATVGIYQASYRLGIFMMLLVSMFDFAWRPFFLAHAGDADAKELFARVLTYFITIVSFGFIVMSFFIAEVVQIPFLGGRSILPPEYWPGLPIVPVILLGYVFLGVSNNLVAGIHIEKHTHHLPWISFLGAGVNVFVNLLLIPSFGIMGAALATLSSYAAMAILMYIIAQRIYPVQYELSRIAKIGIAAGTVYALHVLVDMGDLRFVWKLGLILLFCLLLYWMRIFRSDELRGLGLMLNIGKGGNGLSKPN